MLKRVESSGRRIRKATYFFLVLALCGFPVIIATQAAELDDFGPPLDNDVSHQTGPFIGLVFSDNALTPCINDVPDNPPDARSVSATRTMGPSSSKVAPRGTPAT